MRTRYRWCNRAVAVPVACAACLIWSGGALARGAVTPRGFVNPAATSRPGVWVAGTASAMPASSVAALAKAGFGAAQLDIDAADPSAAPALTPALATGHRDRLAIEPNVTGAVCRALRGCCILEPTGSRCASIRRCSTRWWRSGTAGSRPTRPARPR